MASLLGVAYKPGGTVAFKISPALWIELIETIIFPKSVAEASKMMLINLVWSVSISAPNRKDKGYNWPDSWLLSWNQSVAAYYASPAANYSPDQKDRWTKLTIIHPFIHPSIVIMGESESESETNDQNLHLKAFTPVHQWSAYSIKCSGVVAR